MSIATKSTATHLIKSKKPLSDLHQLQRAVKDLQRGAADQLVLEVESQATFEFLSSQIKALKTAFDTLSDVLLGELDTLRQETHRRVSEVEAQSARQLEMHKAAQTEVRQLKRTMELWALKERDWAKDNEVLKASHAHNVQWMQTLQRDVMEVKDKMHGFQSDAAQRMTDLCSETNQLRTQWHAQVEDVTDRVQEFQQLLQQHTADARVQAQQHAQDVELMEQALRTMQTQHMQVRTSLEDHVQSIGSQSSMLGKQVDMLEQTQSAYKAGLEQVRQRCAAIDKEQRRRMESVSKMFTIFAESMHLSPARIAQVGAGLT